ncbi:MAG: synthase subunit [Actinomycetota bacterium]
MLAAEGKVIDPARSIHWLWPAQAELIYGSIASALIFGVLFKFAGPAVKKAMSARTDRIQAELDGSAEAKRSAEADAADIRRAAGDIESERQRLLADADAQAASLIAEGRGRLEAELADLRARAEADIAAAGGRANDELRAEISRLAAAATDRVIADGALDDATQQALIESFISRVGASS